MDCQEMFTDFIKDHTHMSVADLEDIGKLAERCYYQGRADGLERGAQALLEINDLLFGDSG